MGACLPSSPRVHLGLPHPWVRLPSPHGCTCPLPLSVHLLPAPPVDAPAAPPHVPLPPLRVHLVPSSYIYLLVSLCLGSRRTQSDKLHLLVEIFDSLAFGLISGLRWTLDGLFLPRLLLLLFCGPDPTALSAPRSPPPRPPSAPPQGHSVSLAR